LKIDCLTELEEKARDALVDSKLKRTEKLQVKSNGLQKLHHNQNQKTLK
jgi:hypothetical protein